MSTNESAFDMKPWDLRIARQERFARIFGRVGGTILVALFFAFLLSLPLAYCARGFLVNDDIAVRALETAGYTDVQITEKAWFAIGFRGGEDSDAARFTAKAKNPSGKEVTVYVFSGWLFKGATIRSL